MTPEEWRVVIQTNYRSIRTSLYSYLEQNLEDSEEKESCLIIYPGGEIESWDIDGDTPLPVEEGDALMLIQTESPDVEWLESKEDLKKEVMQDLEDDESNYWKLVEYLELQEEKMKAEYLEKEVDQAIEAIYNRIDEM